VGSRGVATSAWSVAVVVGASSGIGEQVARRLVALGCRVALVARRRERLDALAADLRAGTDTEPNVIACPHDVTDGAAVASLWERIEAALGTVDLLVYCAGAMPAVEISEYTFAKDRLMVEVNVIGAMSWLDEGALRMQTAGRGTLVGVSSVAGDRGRVGQPAYNASKAALSTFLEALYNRLWRHGVHVVDVRPGPVHTPMTAHVKGLSAISAETAAAGLLRAAAARRRVAYVPGKWRVIMCVIRSIPSFVFKRLGI
jgi:short-subunit dehydrogenase